MLRRNKLKGSTGFQVTPHSSAKNSSPKSDQLVDEQSSSSITLQTNSLSALDHVNKETLTGKPYGSYRRNTTAKYSGLRLYVFLTLASESSSI